MASFDLGYVRRVLFLRNLLFSQHLVPGMLSACLINQFPMSHPHCTTEDIMRLDKEFLTLFGI
jgi:hypothetical protein